MSELLESRRPSKGPRALGALSVEEVDRKWIEITLQKILA